MEKIDLYGGDTLAKVLHYYNYPSDDEKIVCPFHEDVYPSMQVNYGSGSCFCYGCQKSYDALSFVKKLENIDDDIEACIKLIKITKFLQLIAKSVDIYKVFVVDYENFPHLKYKTCFCAPNLRGFFVLLTFLLNMIMIMVWKH